MLQITSPTDGTTVMAGQNIVVKVSASGGTFVQMAIIARHPIGWKILTGPPWEFTIPIPLNITPGRYVLGASGMVAPGEGAESEPIAIIVERSDGPQRVRVEPTSLVGMWVGQQTSLRVIGTFQDGSTADVAQSARTTYSSTSTAVVTVTSDGRVTAVAPGSAQIVVSNGTKFYVPVRVLPHVSVIPAQATLYASQSYDFTTLVRIASDQSATWSVSPPGLGTIIATGPTSARYTAPASVSSQQQATITAASVADNTKSASAAVVLYPPISVSVTPASVTLKASQTQTFAATVTNAINRTVTWSLSPSGVGSLDGTGLYTAPSPIASNQTVTVTATSGKDPTKKATATINLKKSN